MQLFDRGLAPEASGTSAPRQRRPDPGVHLHATMAVATSEERSVEERAGALFETAHIARVRGLGGDVAALREAGEAALALALRPDADEEIHVAAIRALGHMLYYPAADRLAAAPPAGARCAAALANALPPLAALARIVQGGSRGRGQLPVAAPLTPELEQEALLIAEMALVLASSARGTRTLGRLLVPRLLRPVVARALATAASRLDDPRAAAIAQLLERTIGARRPGAVRDAALAALLGALRGVRPRARAVPRPVLEMFAALVAAADRRTVAGLVPIVGRGGPLAHHATRAARRIIAAVEAAEAGALPAAPENDGAESWVAWRAQASARGVDALEPAMPIAGR